MNQEKIKVEPAPAKTPTPGAPRQNFRCGICGRFLPLDGADTVLDFTPDSAYTYERTEAYHASCDAKTGPRSTFKMDFLP